MRRIQVLSILGAVAISAPAMAQARNRGNDGIPPGQRPKAGMCRIWVDGVPPGQQPPATDCATAQMRVPRNGRVIYGSGTGSNGRFDTTNGRILTNGQGTNGQRCVQRADQFGNLRTVCSNGNVYDNRNGTVYGDRGVNGNRGTRRGQHDDGDENDADDQNNNGQHGQHGSRDRGRNGQYDRRDQGINGQFDRRGSGDDRQNGNDDGDKHGKKGKKHKDDGNN